MQTNIYVWRTKLRTGGGGSLQGLLPTGINWGHVAVEVPDHDAPVCPQLYASYWPPKMKPDKYSYNYDDDVAICGKADVVIRINGLDVDAMKQAWEIELARDFDDRGHNCCTVAAEVLRAGFDSSIVSDVGTFMGRVGRMVFNPFDTWFTTWDTWGSDLLVWDPGTVERFANYLKKIAS